MFYKPIRKSTGARHTSSKSVLEIKNIYHNECYKLLITTINNGVSIVIYLAIKFLVESMKRNMYAVRIKNKTIFVKKN